LEHTIVQRPPRHAPLHGDAARRFAHRLSRTDAGKHLVHGGIDITDGVATGRQVTEALLQQGVLAKEAHGQTVRLAPALVATDEDIDLMVSAFHTICAG
jgi:acetylornithine/succinyldiaminopimelate/putrescine aminotransferase